MSDTQFLGMSDDDFLKHNAVEDTKDSDTVVESSATNQDDVVATTTDTVESAEVAPTLSDSTGSIETSTSTKVEEASTTVSSNVLKDGVNTGQETSSTTLTNKGETLQESSPDYEGFYKQIMTPFKANGKTIELRNPAEAIQLMQMGANYTRKMQEVSGHRKVLQMLENNGLLDEGKLSFLIDLDKGNPEAIKKLVKDSGLDPMEIDTSEEPAYREGNHRVTDEEVSFQSTLESLSFSDSGKDAIQTVHKTWDQASKEVLWKTPEILTVMHEQMQTGVYPRIAAEIDRQRTLGKLQPNVMFLQAYRDIGEEMSRANAFADLLEPKPEANRSTAQGKAAVVATRVATPKPVLANSEKANAASPTRTTPSISSNKIVNVLAMNDDDFMKQMASRV